MANTTKGKHRRGKLTPTGRKAISRAQKRRWAAYRAAKKKGKAGKKKASGGRKGKGRGY